MKRFWCIHNYDVILTSYCFNLKTHKSQASESVTTPQRSRESEKVRSHPETTKHPALPQAQALQPDRQTQRFCVEISSWNSTIISSVRRLQSLQSVASFSSDCCQAPLVLNTITNQIILARGRIRKVIWNGKEEITITSLN